MLLSKLQTTTRDDLRNHPEFKEFRPPSIGHESLLAQFDGTNVFQWFHRTLNSVYWHSYGEPMVLPDADKLKAIPAPKE